MDTFSTWIALTVLYLAMAHFGGIEWIKSRDVGPFSSAPIEAWRKTWGLIWLIGTIATLAFHFV